MNEPKPPFSQQETTTMFYHGHAVEVAINRELKADPKAIRESLKRQRKSRTVKVSQGKLP